MSRKLENAIRDDNYTGEWLQNQLEGMDRKATSANSHLVEVVKHTVDRMVEENKAVFSDEHFLVQLPSFLRDIQDAVAYAEEENKIVNQHILSWIPQTPDKITGALAFVLNGVTNNIEFRNHLLHVDSGL